MGTCKEQAKPDQKGILSHVLAQCRTTAQAMQLHTLAKKRCCVVP